MQENKPTNIEEPVSDLTEADYAKIQQYIDSGLFNISAVNEKTFARILDLYLSGKTYSQISKIVGIEKVIIMYLSHKFNWFDLRKEYLNELESTIRNRLIESRIVNQDFLLQLIQMWQKKIGNKIVKYLATDNEQFANEIDLKEVDKYLKTVEILHRLSADPRVGNNSNQSSPAVGLNLGDGVTIVKKGDNEVEITPKSNILNNALKDFANSRRENEKK